MSTSDTTPDGLSQVSVDTPEGRLYVQAEKLADRVVVAIQHASGEVERLAADSPRVQGLVHYFPELGQVLGEVEQLAAG